MSGYLMATCDFVSRFLEVPLGESIVLNNILYLQYLAILSSLCRSIALV